MNMPLPNPLSPSPGTFLTRLLDTRKRLKSLSRWAPVTGNLKEPEISQPFVSVMLITYNHEKFIRKALDSVLMQVRDFPIEINVIDDASTDNTQDIVRAYAERYPDIVNCYFNPSNAGHIATQLNTIRGFQTLRGRYFCILEGDDYWNDPSRLAKQVAFLERHTDFVACAHQTLKVFDDGRQPPEHFLPFKAFGRNVAEMIDLVCMTGAFHLSSIVYRNVFHQMPPACLYDEFSCDMTINMLYGVFGKFYCLDEYMSAYRVHDGGMFSGRTYEKHWRFHLHGFRRFALYLGPRYWSMFAIAVRGFSRYVLYAPSTGVEVKRLTLGTRLLFIVHFVPAAIICLFSYAGREAYSLRIHRLAKAKAVSTIRIVYQLFSRVIRNSPEQLGCLICRLESDFPRLKSYHRSIRNLIY
jgi:glycosyltransferase involved in cell wall biosynthesis